MGDPQATRARTRSVMESGTDCSGGTGEAPTWVRMSVAGLAVAAAASVPFVLPYLSAQPNFFF